jgi:hypothetical protein
MTPTTVRTVDLVSNQHRRSIGRYRVLMQAATIRRGRRRRWLLLSDRLSSATDGRPRGCSPRQAAHRARLSRGCGMSPTRLRDATSPADETDHANRAAEHLRSNSLKAGPLGKDREVSVTEPLIGDQIQDSRESRTPTWLLGPRRCAR